MRTLIRAMPYTGKTIMKKRQLPTMMYYNPKQMRIPGRVHITIKALP